MPIDLPWLLVAMVFGAVSGVLAGTIAELLRSLSDKGRREAFKQRVGFKQKIKVLMS